MSTRHLGWLVLAAGLLSACGPLPAAGSRPAAPGGPLPAGLWVSDLNTGTVTGYPDPPRSRPALVLTRGITRPESLAFDAGGRLWVGEGGLSPRIAGFDGAAVRSGAGPVAVIRKLAPGLSPEGLAFDPYGNLWVAAGSAVLEYQAAALDNNPAPARALTGAPLDGPDALAFDGAGDLWVANFNNRVVVEYPVRSLTASRPRPGRVVRLPPGAAPMALAFGPGGNLWIACGNDRIYDYQPATGRLLPGLDTDSRIRGGDPGLAFDSAGNLWTDGTGPGPGGQPAGLVLEYPPAGPRTAPEAVLTANTTGNPGTWALAFYR